MTNILSSSEIPLSAGMATKHKVGNAVLAIVMVWGLIMGGGFLYLTLAKPFDSKVQLVEQIDDRPLEVRVLSPEREVVNPSTEITVISNKEISLAEISRVAFQSLGRLDGEYYYIARVSNLAVDTTKMTLEFTDQAGNSASEEITIVRKAFSFPAGFAEVGPWEESEYTLDGDNLAAAVDKQHRLLEDYEPADLVDLNLIHGLYTLNSAQLRAEPARELKVMLDALAAETGKYVTIASGYRAYQTQVRTYSNWVKELGETGANTVSARPGHSEHQLGTTVDFVSEETGWEITSEFGNTVAGKWLAEHAAEYGFIIPYNEDQSAEGGYKEEAWHFRYVGVEE